MEIPLCSDKKSMGNDNIIHYIRASVVVAQSCDGNQSAVMLLCVFDCSGNCYGGGYNCTVTADALCHCDET